jgi:hypothetical protein
MWWVSNCADLRGVLAHIAAGCTRRPLRQAAGGACLNYIEDAGGRDDLLLMPLGVMPFRKQFQQDQMREKQLCASAVHLRAAGLEKH